MLKIRMSNGTKGAESGDHQFSLGGPYRAMNSAANLTGAVCASPACRLAGTGHPQLSDLVLLFLGGLMIISWYNINVKTAEYSHHLSFCEKSHSPFFFVYISAVEAIVSMGKLAEEPAQHEDKLLADGSTVTSLLSLAAQIALEVVRA